MTLKYAKKKGSRRGPFSLRNEVNDVFTVVAVTYY
jgi:hypothetical protein